MSGTAQSSFAIPDDDALIASALEEASIPTLMMSMIHMSGDASLLDGTIRPAGVFINEYQGYMSEEDKATVRARALEMIKNFRDGGCQFPSSPSPALAAVPRPIIQDRCGKRLLHAIFSKCSTGFLALLGLKLLHGLGVDQ